MKRKISLLILLVIAMTSVLALASCKRDEWIIVKEATCTESGLRIYNCIHDNSEHQQKEVIPALGHSYGDWLVLEEATLTQEGIKQHTCTRCHHKELASIPIIEPTLNIIIYDGDKILSTVKLLDDGVYKLTVPAKVGYAFEGFTDKDGKEFPLEGTITDSVSIYANFSILPTSTFEQLRARALDGADKIYIVNDIELTDTVYIVADTEIYVDSDVTLKRSVRLGGGIGDLFVVGENDKGESVITQGKTASLTLKTDKNATLFIDGNKTNVSNVNGSAILILYSSTVNMYDNVVITNCRKLANSKLTSDKYAISYPQKIGGAGVCVANGTFNMFGGEISNCEVNPNELSEIVEEEENLATSSCGGAIYNYGSVNLYGGKLFNNVASRGGAVYNYRDISITNALIEENSATVYGGAIYLAGSQYSKLIVGSSDAKMDSENVRFINNTAKKSGGALFGQMKNSITVYGATSFENNTATENNGGAINTSGALILKKTLFSGNRAASKGGAVYAYYSNPELTTRMVDIDTCQFNGNSASKGGAIAFSASDEKFEKGSIASIINSRFEENNAFSTATDDPELPDTSINPDDDADAATGSFNGNGGALYAARSSDVTVDGTYFVGNSSDRRGGAIYVTGSSALKTVNTVEFDGNSSARAGGIYVYDSSVVKAEQIEATSNTASERGGFAYITGGSQVEIVQITATFNKIVANGVTAATTNYNGGVFYVYNAATRLTVSKFIAENNTSLGNGGVIYISGATVNLTDVSAAFNGSSLGNGGAFAVHTSGKLIIDGINAQNNSAAANGGVLYVHKASAQIGKDGSERLNTMSSNSAKGGGAIYLSDDSDATNPNTEINITSITLTDNNASNNAGALYVYNKAKAAINRLIANGNTSNNYGGVIYISGKANLVVDSVDASANRAKQGGFMYITTGTTTATLKSGNILNNTATDGGNAIFLNAATAYIYIDRNSLQYNSNDLSGKVTLKDLPAQTTAMEI